MNKEKIRLIKRISILCIIIFLVYGVVKHFTKKTAPALPTPSVVAQKPVLTKVTEYVTQTGTMVAYNSVDLVARIEGYLDAVKFTDGTFVKKGQDLFIIEPQPYYEKLKAAEALVAVRKATYAYNSAEYERQKRMYKQNATSLNNVEKWQAQAEASKAEIDKAVADAAISAINYSYTHVLAPFDGRIGRHLVDPGNLVGHGKATDLATIQQMDPIYVYFNLNELDLIKVRAAAKAHDFKPADINTIPVYVSMQNETEFKHEGKLDFVNTGLNASTGTIEFRALLQNKDLELLPGLFVKVRIPLSEPKPQLTIPDTAVQYDQIGPYVMTLDSNNTVVVKRVTLGGIEQQMRAITKGITAQDRVIVSGIQNAIPGRQVAPIQAEKKQ
jgi:RND family efflux transporter MFP subunit